MSDIIIYIIGIFFFVVLYFVVSSLKRTAETSEEAKARNAAEARKVAEREALKTQILNALKEEENVYEAINASLDNNPLRILTNMIPDSSDGGSIKLSQINKKMYKKLKFKN